MLQKLHLARRKNVYDVSNQIIASLFFYFGFSIKIRKKSYIEYLNFSNSQSLNSLNDFILIIIQYKLIIMSSRYHENKRHSRSRSRSKSWNRERHHRNRAKEQSRSIDRHKQRSRSRQRYREKQRSRERDRQKQKQRYYVKGKSRDRKDRDIEFKSKNSDVRDEKLVSKEASISIDWRHKNDTKYKKYRPKHDSSPSRSYSRSSSSSSSSSESSSYQKSKSHRRNRGKKSSRETERNKQKQRQRHHSRSKSSRRGNSRQKKSFRVQKKTHNYYKDGYKSSYQSKGIEGEVRIDKDIAVSTSKASENPKKDNQIQKNENQVLSKMQQKDKTKEHRIRDNIKQVETMLIENTSKISKIIENVATKPSAIAMQIQIAGKQGDKKIPQKTVSFPQPIRRSEEVQAKIPEKQKVSRVVQLIKQSRQNLEVRPLAPNFLMLDSFRTMKKLNAQTLDPLLLASLKKDFQHNFEKQKARVFDRDVQIGEERQNARLLIPITPSDEQLSLLTELDCLKVSMMNLNQMMRQFHLLQ